MKPNNAQWSPDQLKGVAPTQAQAPEQQTDFICHLGRCREIAFRTVQIRSTLAAMAERIYGVRPDADEKAPDPLPLGAKQEMDNILRAIHLTLDDVETEISRLCQFI